MSKVSSVQKCDSMSDDSLLMIFLEDWKKKKLKSSYMYKYVYMCKFQKLTYVEKYTCVFIYVGWTEITIWILLCDHLGFQGLRRGRKGGISTKKRLFLCRFQSGQNSKVSGFSQTAFFSKLSWPSLDTPRGWGKHLTFWHIPHCLNLFRLTHHRQWAQQNRQHLKQTRQLDSKDRPPYTLVPVRNGQFRNVFFSLS